MSSSAATGLVAPGGVGAASPTHKTNAVNATNGVLGQQLPAHDVVTIRYEDLCNGTDLSELIERAYGHNGLGILLVSNVQGYPEKRAALLPLADRFALLPDEVKQQYEDPESSYNVGWSHGKESMKDGAVDTHKGSFYANPLHDQQPTCSASTAFPSYFRPNLWPREHLPELEHALKSLGRTMVDVGLLLLQHCDRYVSSKLASARPGQVCKVLQRSTNPKARLLHYFASSQSSSKSNSSPDAQGDHEQPWCGWHYDHGSLTGLASAMYIKDGAEVANPDPASGLYIKDRHGRVVKAAIPPHFIAFQVGEALQIHSGGLLRATPHYVRAARGPAAAGISRNTFAVFMQPNVEESMCCPEGVAEEDVAIGQWKPGQNFGQFAEETFKKYYGSSSGGGGGTPHM